MVIKFSAKLVYFLLLSLVFFFTTVKTYSQKSRYDKAYLDNKELFFGGVKAGINLTQIDGDYIAGYNKAGLNISGIMYAKIYSNLAWSTEIGYNQKGSVMTNKDKARIQDQNGNPIIQYNINLNYAEIDVLLHFFDKRSNHLGTGVSYGRLVQSNEKLNNTELTQYPFKKNVIDWIIDANVFLYKNIYFNFRYQYSILPVRTDAAISIGRPTQISKEVIFRMAYIF